MQKDIQKEKQLELLMQDEVVLKRLQELQSGVVQKPEIKTLPNTNQKPKPQQNQSQ